MVISVTIYRISARSSAFLQGFSGPSKGQNYGLRALRFNNYITMKKKILFVLICVLSLSILSGCGIAYNNLGANENCIMTNVTLGSNNYRIVGDAQGVAEATYVLGIGGLSSKALYSNAYAEMIKNANLCRSQAIINVVSDQKVAGVPFLFQVRTFTVYGQIIEFNQE